MFCSSFKEINTLIGTGMSNIYLMLRKTDVLKKENLKKWRAKKVQLQALFRETFILALSSSAVFCLQNCVSDFF